MSWDRWHHDPREGEPPEEYRSPDPRGRELTAAEMSAELRRILGPAMDRIRGIEESAHRCVHGVNLERAHCAKCSPIGAHA